MARRKKIRRRPKPIREGKLKELTQWFMRPLDRLRPERMGLDAWRSFLFHVHERFITRHRALEDFEIPDTSLLRHEQDRLPFYGQRKVRRGTPVWIRVDTTRPNAIDMEVCNGQGKAEQWFQLTEDEFGSIKRFLSEGIA